MQDLQSWMTYDVCPSRRWLWIGGDIESDISERAIKGLAWLDAASDDPIDITLNSQGGDWYEGMAVYEAIRACRSFVTIRATGNCMSMATIILQAADERIVTTECAVMIHDATVEISGKSEDAERWSKHHEAGRKRMYEIYHERMLAKQKKLTIAKVKSMCAADTILTARQAVRVGLADKVI